MTLGEAWSQWSAGQLRLTQTCMGLELFWWSRIGKALQLIAGATILAEIVGPERLRAASESTRQVVEVRNFTPVLSHAWVFFQQMIKLVLSNIPLIQRFVPQPNLAIISEYKIIAALDLLLSLMVVAIAFFAGGMSIWEAAVFMCYMVALIGPLIIALLSLIIAVLLWIVDVVILGGTAKLLRTAALDRYVKTFTLALLLVGFHFDFLTS